MGISLVVYYIYTCDLCSNLKSEYVDLYLIHWPVSMKPGEFKPPLKKGDLLPLDYKSVWEAMDRMSKSWPGQINWCKQFLLQKARNLTCHSKDPSSRQSSN
jgi:hypothetical protein